MSRLDPNNFYNRDIIGNYFYAQDIFPLSRCKWLDYRTDKIGTICTAIEDGKLAFESLVKNVQEKYQQIISDVDNFFFTNSENVQPIQVLSQNEPGIQQPEELLETELPEESAPEPNLASSATQTAQPYHFQEGKVYPS